MSRVASLAALGFALAFAADAEAGSPAAKPVARKVVPPSKGSAAPATSTRAAAAPGPTDAGSDSPPTRPFAWDVPKVISEIDIPALFETNGIPNRFHAVVVDLPWEETYWHFHRHFLQSGLWVDPPEKQLQLDGQIALTGFDPNTETSYTVILQPYPSGHTGVIMGEAYFQNRTFAPSSDFAPVFPGAEGLLTQKLEGGLSLSYRVKAKPAEVEQFYSEVLGQSGFVRQPDGTYRSGGEVIQVVVLPGEGGPYANVALLRMSAPSPSGAPWSVTDSQ